MDIKILFETLLHGPLGLTPDEYYSLESIRSEAANYPDSITNSDREYLLALAKKYKLIWKYEPPKSNSIVR